MMRHPIPSIPLFLPLIIRPPVYSVCIMAEEINPAFNKFVYDRVEKDFVDGIVKLEFWKSSEIAMKKSEPNEVFPYLIIP